MKKQHVFSALALLCSSTSIAYSQQTVPIERDFSQTEPIALSGSSLLPAPITESIEEIHSLPDAETARLIKEAAEVDAKQLPVAGQAELVTQRFPNGTPQVERWVVLSDEGNYVNHGAYKRYDTKGNLIAHGEYVMGQRQGEWFQNLDLRKAQGLASNIDRGFTAPFMSKATFQSDTLTGDWTLIDSKGNTVFIWNFAEGKRTGQSSWYNSKGDIIQSIPYQDDLAHGIALLSSRTSSKAREIEYRHGLVLDVVEEFFTGQQHRAVKSREEFLVPMATRIVGHDWAGSSVAIERQVNVQPVKHGSSVHYHPNGQKMSEGKYVYGRETGTFVWWYANGQRRVIGQFENGQEVGPWHFWHDNGMKKTVGRFADGTPTGQWLTWDEQGQLVHRQTGDEVQLKRPDQVAGRQPTAQR